MRNLFFARLVRALAPPSDLLLALISVPILRGGFSWVGREVTSLTV